VSPRQEGCDRALQPLGAGTCLGSALLPRGAPHLPLCVVLVGPGDAGSLLRYGRVERRGHLQSLHRTQLPLVAAKPGDGVGEKGRGEAGDGMGWAGAGWRIRMGLGVPVRMGAVGGGRRGCGRCGTSWW